MKRNTVILLLLLVIFGKSSVIAQTTNKESEFIASKDPIVAMLDSLVTLNNLNKFYTLHNNQFGKNHNFDSEHVPLCTPEEIKARFKKMSSPIPLQYNEHVKAYIDLYAVRKRQLTSTIIGLTQLYFPLFEKILDQQGLPLEFKYLSVIESALNPLAVSKCGATGLWQFMYETGRQYNLNINSFVDERKDPYASTVAACKYFKDMYSIYHDWLLVIAAYNCGAGNVNRAIARSGGKMDFWEISRYLPQETRGYVPAFIAVHYLMNHTKEHNLTATPPPITFFEVDTVQVTNKVTFEQISSFLDVPVNVVQYLNPVYKRNVIPAVGNSYKLRLPSKKAVLFAANSEALYKKIAEQEMVAEKETTVDEPGIAYEYVTRELKKVHLVRKRENIVSIARSYHCSVAELKRWNHLKTSKVHPGQKLMVITSVTQRIEKKTAPDTNLAKQTTLAKDSASVTTTSVKAEEPVCEDTKVEAKKPENNSHPKVKYIYHVVQKGDTLWNIAQRYNNASVQKIREINNSAVLKRLIPGTKIKVAVEI